MHAELAGSLTRTGLRDHRGLQTAETGVLRPDLDAVRGPLQLHVPEDLAQKAASPPEVSGVD